MGAVNIRDVTRLSVLRYRTEISVSMLFLWTYDCLLLLNNRPSEQKYTFIFFSCSNQKSRGKWELQLPSAHACPSSFVLHWLTLIECRAKVGGALPVARPNRVTLWKLQQLQWVLNLTCRNNLSFFFFNIAINPEPWSCYWGIIMPWDFDRVSSPMDLCVFSLDFVIGLKEASAVHQYDTSAQ